MVSGFVIDNEDEEAIEAVTAAATTVARAEE